MIAPFEVSRCRFGLGFVEGLVLCGWGFSLRCFKGFSTSCRCRLVLGVGGLVCIR